MIKRILVAVAITLLVPLIFLLGATQAFADLPNGKRAAQPLPAINPAAPLFGQDDAQPMAREILQKLAVPYVIIDMSGVDLSKNYVPTFTCVDQDNTDYASGFGTFTFYDNGASGGAVPRTGNIYFVQDNFLCSLTGTWLYFNDLVGDIDGEIGIWASAGGIPTAQVGSVIINSTTTALGWNFYDLTSLGLTFTDDFAVTFGTVLGSAVDPVNDKMQCLVDAAGSAGTTPRTGVSYWVGGPGWFTNLGLFGAEFNLLASAIVCCEEIPFTSCFLETNADSYSFIFSLPSTFNCRKGLAMRYSTGGFDTLLTAEISLSDFFTGGDPDGEVVLEMLADDGAGVPDAASPLAPALTVGGVGLGGDLYPLGSFGWIDYPLGGLVPGPSVTYHISVRWTGPDPSVSGGSGIGADDYTLGEGSLENFASVYFADNVLDLEYASCPTPVGLEGWSNYFSTFGINPDFLIDVNVCHDEFINCELVESAASFSFISDFAEADGFTGFSGLYNAGGDECRIDIATIYFHKWDDITGVEVGVYSDAGGAPGVALYSEIIPSTAFANPAGVAGTQAQTIFPNGGAGIQIMGGYHVVARPQFTGSGLGLYRIIIDDGSGGVRGHYESGGSWFPSDAVFGSGNSYFTESFRCCVPFGGMSCGPGDSWPTYQHDQQRTGLTFTSLGDANCNLNLLWSAQSSSGNSFSGSITFDDKIIISNDNGNDCRLIADGSLVWDENTDPTVSSLFTGALSNRTQPTVATIETVTGPVQMAFLGTGLNRDIVAVNAQTGAYIWHNTTNSPFFGLAPNATNVKSIVLYDGTDDILYYATQKKVYAVLAATGAPYTSWAINPYIMDADNVNALTTNNADVANSQIVLPVFSGAIEGDVYSLDAATGVLNWKLSTIAGAGLQASRDALDGYTGNEGFFSGASYDANLDVFWVNSSLDADFPEEGYLYKIVADGSGFSTAKSVGSRRATPVISFGNIYVPAFTKWANPIHSGEQIYSRTTGAYVQGMEGHVVGDRQYNDGLITCETNGPSYYIHGTELGNLNFYKTGTVNALQFYRQTTLSEFNGGQWAGGSSSPDAIYFTTFGGLTVALGSGPNRPRLSLPANRQDLAIPFGTPNGFDANFPSVIGNSGCNDLIVNGITFTDPVPPSGTRIEFSAVDPTLRARMSEQANFTTNSNLFEKFGLMYGRAPKGLGPNEAYANETTLNSPLNYRSAVLPDIIDGATGASGLISPSAGTAILPGDTADLHVAINGPLVTRGPHDFTAHIDTNDPDYFLDDPSAIPTVALRVIGGCLEDSVVLTFGIGGANSAIVFNDALVQHFNSDGNNSLNIDGFDTGSEFFAGIRGWSLTPHRMAWTGSAWDFIGGWNTILADLNYCSNTCLPTLQSNVLLGAISTDSGVTYTDVFGDVIGLTYIDSARDYIDGNGEWDWQSNPSEFLPDSTIGIIVNETHYGAHDVLALNNVQLIRLDVTNRSAVSSIDDLQHFAVHDDDVSLADVMIGGGSFGYVFGEYSASTSLHGYGVVGYGCDVAPLFRGKNCNAELFMFHTGVGDNIQAFDSIYAWGREAASSGITAQAYTAIGDDGSYTYDGESYYNFGGLDLGPGETKSLGIFHFAFSNASDPSVYDGEPLNYFQFEGMADLVNKWAGFGRGDVNDDMVIDLADVVFLAGAVSGGAGPFPFAHLGDVNNDASVDAADVAYMIDFYFNCGPCPVDDWSLAFCSQ